MNADDSTAAGTDRAEGDVADAYRRIPSVNLLVEMLIEAGWEDRLPRCVITDAARTVIEEYRKKLGAKRPSGSAPQVSTEALAKRAEALLEIEARLPLSSAINATGIILHTGLGRAPMADAVVEAIADVARHYAPVELVMSTGERGKRATLVRKLLCDITGSESATVVNNNTAALMIVLATIAKGRNVIVSRGELIEIGGSFRLPEVIHAGGAILREVGTTNKTRPADYERAIDDHAAAIIKIHTSNYRLEGFTEEATLEELVEIGRRYDLPVVHDIGSGVLVDAARYGLPGDEPDAAASIAAGVDLVLFSGDKLLGAPQAGVIVGRREWIERIEKNPMMRAVRVDKLTLAGLGATLQLHRDPEWARRHMPILKSVTTPMEELEERGRLLVERLQSTAGVKSVRLCEAPAYLGGGSVPGQEIPSVAIELRPASISDDELAARLRQGSPAVVPRVKAGAVWFDLRTVLPHQDDQLVRGVESALG